MKPGELSRIFPFSDLDKYIEEKVLPKMQMSGRKFSIQRTGLGNRNIIFFLHIADSRDTVLKGFARKARLKNNLLANRILTRNSISAPRILFSDLSQKTFIKFGCCFSCEEKIEGKNLCEIDNLLEVLPSVAKFYARMHNIGSSRWGKPASSRKYGFSGYVMDKTLKWLNKLKCPETGLKDSELRSCSKWFEKKLDSIKAIRHFSLCHGDVNKKNIMVSPCRQVTIIDNEAVKNLPFPIEYFRLKFILCEDNVKAQKIFEQSYFENCSSEKRHEFEACNLFYRAFVLLELFTYFNKKLKHHHEGDSMKNFYESNRQRALINLKKLVTY